MRIIVSTVNPSCIPTLSTKFPSLLKSVIEMAVIVERSKCIVRLTEQWVTISRQRQRARKTVAHVMSDAMRKLKCDQPFRSRNSGACTVGMLRDSDCKSDGW